MPSDRKKDRRDNSPLRFALSILASSVSTLALIAALGMALMPVAATEGQTYSMSDAGIVGSASIEDSKVGAVPSSDDSSSEEDAPNVDYSSLQRSIDESSQSIAESFQRNQVVSYKGRYVKDGIPFASQLSGTNVGMVFIDSKDIDPQKDISDNQTSKQIAKQYSEEIVQKLSGIDGANYGSIIVGYTDADGTFQLVATGGKFADYFNGVMNDFNKDGSNIKSADDMSKYGGLIVYVYDQTTDAFSLGSASSKALDGYEDNVIAEYKNLSERINKAAKGDQTVTDIGSLDLRNVLTDDMVSSLKNHGQSMVVLDDDELASTRTLSWLLPSRLVSGLDDTFLMIVHDDGSNTVYKNDGTPIDSEHVQLFGRDAFDNKVEWNEGKQQFGDDWTPAEKQHAIGWLLSGIFLVPTGISYVWAFDNLSERRKRRKEEEIRNRPKSSRENIDANLNRLKVESRKIDDPSTRKGISVLVSHLDEVSRLMSSEKISPSTRISLETRYETDTENLLKVVDALDVVEEHAGFWNGDESRSAFNTMKGSITALDNRVMKDIRNLVEEQSFDALAAARSIGEYDKLDEVSEIFKKESHSGETVDRQKKRWNLFG